MTTLTIILSSSLGAAIASGVFSIVLYRMKRADEQKDKDKVETKALRYIMLYIIQERAKDHIREGEITLEDLRSLHCWHDLYHNGLEGNGDADELMRRVEALKITTD